MASQAVMIVLSPNRSWQQTAVSKCTKEFTNYNCPLRAVVLPLLYKQKPCVQSQLLLTMLSIGLHMVLLTCTEPWISLLGTSRHKLPHSALRTDFSQCRARITTTPSKPATADEMATTKINLSAPIYGSDGTGIVPNNADERVEPAGELLSVVQQAFRRQLRKAGQQGDAMRAMFGKQSTPFLFPSCVSSTNDCVPRHWRVRVCRVCRSDARGLHPRQT